MGWHTQVSNNGGSTFQTTLGPMRLPQRPAILRIPAERRRLENSAGFYSRSISLRVSHTRDFNSVRIPFLFLFLFAFFSSVYSLSLSSSWSASPNIFYPNPSGQSLTGIVCVPQRPSGSGSQSHKQNLEPQGERATVSPPDTMAKKKPGQVPNRHIYTRISFLYQAAAYLAQPAKQDPDTASRQYPLPASGDAGADTSMERDGDRKQSQAGPIQHGNPLTAGQNMSRKLLTDLRAITQKSVIRTSPHIKRSICKYCDTLLVDGQTSSSAVENKSKAAKKPWADVLVIKCHTCGREKRFPINAPNQKRRQLRSPKHSKATEKDAAPPMGDQVS